MRSNASSIAAICAARSDDVIASLFLQPGISSSGSTMSWNTLLARKARTISCFESVPLPSTSISSNATRASTPIPTDSSLPASLPRRARCVAPALPSVPFAAAPGVPSDVRPSAAATAAFDATFDAASRSRTRASPPPEFRTTVLNQSEKRALTSTSRAPSFDLRLSPSTGSPDALVALVALCGSRALCEPDGYC